MKPPKLVDIPPPQPVDDECAVHLTRAALNRRDIWIMKGQYPGISLPTVLGSDGVGRLKTSVGDLASGSRVVLYPGRNWGPSETVQRSEYEILGLPRQGTFAEEICVPKETVYACPAHLNDAEAGRATTRRGHSVARTLQQRLSESERTGPHHRNWWWRCEYCGSTCSLGKCRCLRDQQYRPKTRCGNDLGLCWDSQLF